MNTDNPATMPDKKQARELLPKARFAITSNLWSFMLFGVVAALYRSCSLQEPMNRVLLLVWTLLAVWSAIRASQARHEQRIVKLLDCLEHKGVLSVEDRAAIGIVPPPPSGAIRAMVIGGAIFIAMLITVVVCEVNHRL